MKAPRAGLRTVFAAALLAVLSATCGAALADSQPDSFYLALLRDGRSEMARGDAVAAKKSFRLACFGFLEQPVLLAEGLVRLGLAESELNDREAFVATFARFTEVEDRFAAYAAAAVSGAERTAFETRALEWIAPEVLRTLPSFAPLLARKREVDLAKLPPRERLRELEKRSEAEPGNSHLKVLLAQEEASEERWAKVIARLEGVPDGSEAGAAGCLRGRALARLKRCEEAVGPLDACVATAADPVLAEAQLSCLTSLDRGDAARAFAARLPRAVAENPAVRKAIARVPAPAPAAVSPAAPPPADPSLEAQPKAGKDSDSPTKVEAPAKVPAPKAGRPAAAKPAAAPPSASLTADEERDVAAARGMLKAVENRDELRRGFAQIAPVADRLPARADLQSLAGEIAYRAGLWSACSQYLRRTSPGNKGPTDPTQRFYYAVCLFEDGKFAAAAEVAATGLENLQRPPFVETYLQKIRAARP